jgi:hypothetical protein
MKTTKITGTIICAGKLKDNNGEYVYGVLIEADLLGKTVPFYKSVEIVEIDEPGYQIAEHDKKKCAKLSRHPLAQRLIMRMKNLWEIHPNARTDIKAAATLMDEQHTAISLALAAVLDDDLKKCIEILGVASNEYPFLTDAEKREREAP